MVRRSSSERGERKGATLGLVLVLVGAILFPRIRCNSPSRPAYAESNHPLTMGGPRISHPHFPYTSGSNRLKVSADVEQPIEELRMFAEGALREIRKGLGAEPDPMEAPRYSIYLCGELETIRRLEESHGLPRSDPGPFRTFEFRGGFYPEANMVALRCAPGEDARWNIAHELSHAAFYEVVGKSCDAINEGLADYNAAQVLGWPQTQYLLDAVAEAQSKHLIPSLKSLFALDYWEFRDDRVHWRYFGLSWSLVRLLLENDAPAIEGRFPRFMAEMKSMEPWQALQVTYDIASLEQAWREGIESATKWSPIWGDWQEVGGSLEATIPADKGMAMIVHRDAPPPGQPFEIRARVTGGLAPGSEVGCVVGYQDYYNYTVVVIRVSESLCLVARRQSDRWTSSSYQTAPRVAAEWTSADFCFSCEADGQMVLAFGDLVLARFPLGEDAFRGRVGIFADPRLSEGESGLRRINFERVRVSTGPEEKESNVDSGPVRIEAR